MQPNTDTEVVPEVTHETPKDEMATDTTTLLSILAYLGPLVVVSYLMGKDNPFVLYHAKQGIVLFATELGLYIVSSFMFFGFFILMPFIGLLNLGCFVLAIIGIVHVAQKVMKPLPIIGNLSKHVPF